MDASTPPAASTEPLDGTDRTDADTLDPRILAIPADLVPWPDTLRGIAASLYAGTPPNHLTRIRWCNELNALATVIERADVAG